MVSEKPKICATGPLIWLIIGRTTAPFGHLNLLTFFPTNSAFHLLAFWVVTWESCLGSLGIWPRSIDGVIKPLDLSLTF